MKTISRKSMLYRTGVEYGSWAMNHVLGCSHGCLYPCYAFLMAKRFGRVSGYEQWCSPVLVENTLELLDREIPKYASRIDSVQLCFTTDPFMYEYDTICQISIDAIQKLNDSGIHCTALTKGVLPKQLADLSKSNSYGITISSLNEEYRKASEPGAATFTDRIASLRYLHEQGCLTWVSMEPYPTPNMIEQDLDTILNELAFVDRFIFGRTNYSKIASSYEGRREFYNECADTVISFCTDHNIEYLIKEGTQTKQ